MSFSRHHFSILTLPILAAKCHRNSSFSSLLNLSLKDFRSSRTCSRGRDSASSLSIKKEYLRHLHVGRLASASLKSNLRGYPAASFEASLHNLLTWASLRRVATHCTCEKTTVAISKLGSNVGWYASILRLPLRSCMVALRGREWEDVVALLARPSAFLVGRPSCPLFCAVVGFPQRGDGVPLTSPTRLTARERTAPEREDTMAKRKAAPPEEDSEEEEYYEDDLEDGSDEDEDGEAAAGGGRDFDEEEDDDDELEAEMAALESVRNERGMGRSDRPLVNNEAGLDASIQGERPVSYTHLTLPTILLV